MCELLNKLVGTGGRGECCVLLRKETSYDDAIKYQRKVSSILFFHNKVDSDSRKEHRNHASFVPETEQKGGAFLLLSLLSSK